MSATDENRKTVDAEEDLDDLDDVLEKFTPAPPPAKSVPVLSAAPSATATSPTFGPIPPPTNADDDDDEALDTDKFNRELRLGMESLMAELGAPSASGSGSGAGEPGSNAQEAAFKRAWEQMLIDGMNGMTPDLNGEDFDGAGGTAWGAQAAALKNSAQAKGKSAAPTSASTAPTSGADQDFQKTIKAAMEKLKTSEAGLSEKSGNPDDDPLAALLAQLGVDPSLANVPVGEESEEDMAKMLETMMGALMGKDVLYEPLKELHDKFPEYLRENESTISAEDKARYLEQQQIIKEVVELFEKPGYNEAVEMPTISDLMGRMQALGAPPASLMGDMPPGLTMGPDGMPELPEGCRIS